MKKQSSLTRVPIELIGIWALNDIDLHVRLRQQVCVAQMLLKLFGGSYTMEEVGGKLTRPTLSHIATRGNR